MGQPDIEERGEGTGNKDEAGTKSLEESVDDEVRRVVESDIWVEAAEVG